MADTDYFQVDLTNCDREPIHQLGKIQSFAWLLAFTSDWTVCRVSRNIDTLLGHDFETVLGMSIGELFDAGMIHLLRGRSSLLRNAECVERIFAQPLLSNEKLYDIALHLNGRNVVMEIEENQQDNLGDPGSMVRTMMGRLDETKDIAEFLNMGARLVRAVTQFNRVKVYKFDRNGHGQVVAESRSSGIDSFLGLHYPASDIPRQARALYIRAPFRIIANVHDEPVAILPQLNEKGEPLDLSLSISRSVSPIHLEYLGNMGVDASLSISIIVEGKLWGLFACHHYAPKLPSFNARTLTELFGQLFSLKLEGRIRMEVTEQERAAREIGNSLLAGIADDASLLSDPGHISNYLRQIIPNDGISTLVDGNISSAGMTPPDHAVTQLAKRLNSMEGGHIFHRENIGELMPSASDYAHLAAGFLAIPISRKPRDYVFLFRKEQSRTVSWAGNPEKPVAVSENGARLTPRGSFETWREEIKGSCTAFSDSELNVAEALRSVLTEVVLRITDRARDESDRLSQRQELLIAELNHRVRNILSLIRGIIRQSARGEEGDQPYIGLLEGRIESLARAHNQITKQNWSPAPLKPLIETEAKAYLYDQTTHVEVIGQDVALEPEAYTTIALVIHEMMTNSAKYGALSDSGTVTITLHVAENGRLDIHWEESGGPPVAPPARRGFGTTIIERSIPHDLGGEAHLDFRVTGLVGHFVIPARFVNRTTPQTHHHGRYLPSAPPLAPPPAADAMNMAHVLLVEDSLLIAMDTEEALSSLGVERVSIASTAQQAFHLLKTTDFDAAILDLNLGEENSLAVADHLLQRGISFVFATGYGDQVALEPKFSKAAFLQKPYSREQLRNALLKLARRGVETG